jgi:hypothetical protein
MDSFSNGKDEKGAAWELLSALSGYLGHIRYLGGLFRTLSIRSIARAVGSASWLSFGKGTVRSAVEISLGH